MQTHAHCTRPHQVGKPVAAAAEAAAHASWLDAMVSHSSRSTAGASVVAICFIRVRRVNFPDFANMIETVYPRRQHCGI